MFLGEIVLTPDPNVRAVVERVRRAARSWSRCVNLQQGDADLPEPDVAAKAALYLKYLSFGIPGYGGNMVIKKWAFGQRLGLIGRYLQAQGLMHVPTYVLFIVSPLNLVFNYLLVRPAGFAVC